MHFHLESSTKETNAKRKEEESPHNIARIYWHTRTLSPTLCHLLYTSHQKNLPRLSPKAKKHVTNSTYHLPNDRDCARACARVYAAQQIDNGY